MEVLKRINELKTGKLLKLGALVLAVIILLALAFRLIGSSFKSVLPERAIIAKNAGVFSLAQTDEALDFEAAGGTAGLSLRNTAPAQIIRPKPGQTAGAQAEEFEVTEYRGTIETGRLQETCAELAELKGLDYVIFENASQADKSCNYTFKVKLENAGQILDIVNNLDPKELTETIYTIKRLLDDFTGELEILQKQQAAIDATLENAIKSYDNITVLANRVQDVESLAKIIESKISIVERLTQERLNLSSQLERLERAKAEQLDRLAYTYFYLDVYENKFVDFEILKESWQRAVKQFVSEVNGVVQDLTVNLLAWILMVLQYLVYLFVLLLAVKYGWRLVKYFWQK